MTDTGRAPNPPGARPADVLPLHPSGLLALADPELTGAACAGRAPLHDADIDGEPAEDRDRRHRSAAAVCQRCPVRAACAALVPTLPRRASGIWAGWLLDGRHDPRPIPTTEGDAA